MNTGGSMLIDQHGSRIGVAIAWIKGEVDTFENCIGYVVDETTVAAAKARLELVAAGIIPDPDLTTK
jgi:hypothetical protein